MPCWSFVLGVMSEILGAGKGPAGATPLARAAFLLGDTIPPGSPPSLPQLFPRTVLALRPAEILALAALVLCLGLAVALVVRAVFPPP